MNRWWRWWWWWWDIYLWWSVCLFVTKIDHFINLPPVRHQKSSLPQEGQLGLQAPWDEVQRSDFQNAAWLVSIYYFLEILKIWTSIPNMSWALEAQSNTLRTPQKEPACTVSYTSLASYRPALASQFPKPTCSWKFNFAISGGSYILMPHFLSEAENLSRLWSCDGDDNDGINNYNDYGDHRQEHDCGCHQHEYLLWALKR